LVTFITFWSVGKILLSSWQHSFSITPLVGQTQRATFGIGARVTPVGLNTEPLAFSTGLIHTPKDLVNSFLLGHLGLNSWGKLSVHRGQKLFPRGDIFHICVGQRFTFRKALCEGGFLTLFGGSKGHNLGGLY